MLLTGELKAASAIDCPCRAPIRGSSPIRWLAEDGTVVKAGDRRVEFDNSAFTKQLEEKKLALLEAEMTLRSTEALGMIDAASKQTELDQAKIALAKATVQADVPADLLSGRDSQERQLEQKRAEIAVEEGGEGRSRRRKAAAGARAEGQGDRARQGEADDRDAETRRSVSWC